MRKPKVYNPTCPTCKKQFQTTNPKKKYCSVKPCYRIGNAVTMAILRKEGRYKKQKPPEAKTKVRKVKSKSSEKELLLLDKKQLELNRQIDDRLKVTLEEKHYKPGDPEFEAIAATVTPLKNIRKCTFA